ncbi:MAG: divalent-cation tolerance protein CutA [Opitutae bacterium]|nr:divalent-cation tolerance protein CutA [Opitutae bacterium]MBT5910779.1 divalent-cation tolerance protein CutA [Opitutae bacterium]
MPNLIRVGCTTLETRQQALDLGRTLVALDLVACAQVVGPVASVYRWEGKIDESEEWELRLKYSWQNENTLSRYISENHPYEEPQWVSWEADASEGYAKWVTLQKAR